MFDIFSGNIYRLVQYVLIWIVYAILQSFVFHGLVSLSFGQVLLDGFIHAVLMGAIVIMLLNVVKYGNYAVLTVYQRVINYIAIAVIAIGGWLGIGYLVVDIVGGNEIATKLLPLMPVRGFIGLLIYLIIVQKFQDFQNKSEEFQKPQSIEIEEEFATEKLTSSCEILERITVKSGNKINVINVVDIVFLQADGDYVQIFTKDSKYLKEQTLKSFEEQLPKNLFVRVHRSCIVNVEMISRIELYEKQSQLLTLKNGQQVKTSPNGYKALRVALNI